MKEAWPGSTEAPAPDAEPQLLRSAEEFTGFSDRSPPHHERGLARQHRSACPRRGTSTPPRAEEFTGFSDRSPPHHERGLARQHRSTCPRRGAGQLLRSAEEFTGFSDRSPPHHERGLPGSTEAPAPDAAPQLLRSAEEFTGFSDRSPPHHERGLARQHRSACSQTRNASTPPQRGGVHRLQRSLAPAP